MARTALSCPVVSLTQGCGVLKIFVAGVAGVANELLHICIIRRIVADMHGGG